MAAPPIRGIRETALYCDDLDRAAAFYRNIVGLTPLLETERLVALDAGAGAVLLLFQRGASLADMPSERGVVPGHDGSGPLHMALAIAVEDYDRWHGHLTASGIAVRAEMHWPRGGRSLYFDDPDGHVIELATPGLWANDGDLP